MSRRSRARARWERLERQPVPAVAWKLSDHARERAEQMNVTVDQVLEVLNDPEVVRPADPHRHPGARLAVRGQLTVPFVGVHVLTVLWSRWDDGEGGAELRQGRFVEESEQERQDREADEAARRASPAPGVTRWEP